MRIFVPEEGKLLVDRAVVVCSKVEGNPGAGVTEAAELIRGVVSEAFRLVDPVWIEHHAPASTDGQTETFELAVFSAFGKTLWKPLDRSAVKTLLGRSV